MTGYESEEEAEATAEQLELLKELGVDLEDIAGISMADAEAMINELRPEPPADPREAPIRLPKYPHRPHP